VKPALVPCVLLFAATAFAQAPRSPRSADFAGPAGTPIEELVAVMLKNNLELQAARTRLEQSEGRLVQARLRPNPRAEYQEKNDRIFSNLGHREEELTVNQPLELWGRRGRRIDVAENDAERIRWEIADLERRRAAELRALAAQALSEVARLQALERGAELTEKLRGATDVRIKAGDASQYESAQVDGESGRLESEALRAGARAESLILQIKALARLPEGAPLVLRDAEIGARPPAIGLEEALRAAVEARPDLAAALAAEHEAEARVKLASANGGPDVGAILGFKRSGTVSPVKEFDWQLKIGISVVLPLWNRNQGTIQEQAAVRSEARLMREELEQVIRRDVAIAHRRLQQAQKDAKLYEEKLLPVGRRSVDMAKLGFDLGEIRLVDYILEQRRLIDVETGWAQARAELLQARFELERAVGRNLVP
jgi:cobalt-zinc-cadmium efflux system outer membrane protein